jgi:hypothetical protein
MSAASPAILRSDGLNSAAAAAVAKRRASGHQYGVHSRVRRACPQQRHEPSDPGPTCHKIQDENPRGVALIVPDDRRQKIQQTRNEKKRHVRTSESFNFVGPVGFVLDPTQRYDSNREFVPALPQLQADDIPFVPPL